MSRLVVLGGGESGYGSAVLAKVQGLDVFVSDKGTIAEKYKEILQHWKIKYEEGQHTMELILNADEVVKSPGIPDKVEVVQEIRKRGIPVISEIEFASRYTSAKTICITGSNGKTTTTSLTYQILKDAGFNVALGGNIGESFAYSVATKMVDWYVLELSSFQLDGMYDFRADIAVLMNITPDHLDRYEYKMQNYVDSKMRIIQNQTEDDFFIYSGDDYTIAKELDKYPLPMHLLPFSVKRFMAQGAVVNGRQMECRVGDREFAIDVDQLKVKGIHNTYNAMAATMTAMAAGVKCKSIAKTLAEFSGVEHRLEMVGEWNGVQYINDSKATNVDSAWYALESMTRPTVWIAGGTDKGNDYAPLMDFAREKVKAVVCMGLDNEKLMKSFGGVVEQVYSTDSLEAAMVKAKELAVEGDAVLLSPACASFDLFKNYEDRGRQFKEWCVSNL